MGGQQHILSKNGEHVCGGLKINLKDWGMVGTGIIQKIVLWLNLFAPLVIQIVAIEGKITLDLGKPSRKKNGETWEKVQTGREGVNLPQPKFPTS